MDRAEQERSHVASLMGAIAISHHDLEALVAMASARLPDARAEARRTALLDDVHRAGLDAGRLLGDFVRHMLCESRGSHTAVDVAGEARACFGALRDYSGAIRRARDGFGELIALRVDGGEGVEPGRAACA